MVDPVTTGMFLMSLASFAQGQNEKNEQLEDQAEAAGIKKAGTAFKRERNRVKSVAAIQDIKSNAETQRQIIDDRAKEADDRAQLAAAFAGTTGASVQEVSDKVEFNRQAARASVGEDELFSLDQLARDFSDFNLANQDARTKFRGRITPPPLSN